MLEGQFRKELSTKLLHALTHRRGHTMTIIAEADPKVATLRNILAEVKVH